MGMDGEGNIMAGLTMPACRRLETKPHKFFPGRGPGLTLKMTIMIGVIEKSPENIYNINIRGNGNKIRAGAAPSEDEMREMMCGGR